MKRNYSHGVSENVDFFFGTEVEQTPAYGMDTLFVVGVQRIELITSKLRSHIKHIYFGANQSFPIVNTNDADVWNQWEKMISHFLSQDYLCTLDIDISCVEGLAESSLCEHNQFIPMISAKLPYIQLLNYNAILKLDDKDFNHSNPGVWCHSIHNLKNRQAFTAWKDYTKDEVIK